MPKDTESTSNCYSKLWDGEGYICICSLVMHLWQESSEERILSLTSLYSSQMIFSLAIVLYINNLKIKKVRVKFANYHLNALHYLHTKLKHKVKDGKPGSMLLCKIQPQGFRDNKPVQVANHGCIHPLQSFDHQIQEKIPETQYHNSHIT